jgi:hypothetical protein
MKKGRYANTNATVQDNEDTAGWWWFLLNVYFHFTYNNAFFFPLYLIYVNRRTFQWLIQRNLNDPSSYRSVFNIKFHQMQSPPYRATSRNLIYFQSCKRDPVIQFWIKYRYFHRTQSYWWY